MASKILSYSLGYLIVLAALVVVTWAMVALSEGAYAKDKKSGGQFPINKTAVWMVRITVTLFWLSLIPMGLKLINTATSGRRGYDMLR
jgi:hypothetical protein